MNFMCPKDILGYIILQFICIPRLATCLWKRYFTNVSASQVLIMTFCLQAFPPTLVDLKIPCLELFASFINSFV